MVLGENMKNFIVFEGIDGSGKGTQIEKLKQYLAQTNQPAIFTREPGGGKISEDIRRVIKDKENMQMTDLCELLLFEAARNQHLHDVILPNKDKIVVSDRYYLSTLAYQGYGRGINLEIINLANSIAIEGVEPECIVLLDVPPDIGEKRNSVLAEKSDRIEIAGNSFMSRVYEGYKKCAEQNPQKWLVIDGTKSPDEIFEHLLCGLRIRGIIE